MVKVTVKNLDLRSPSVISLIAVNLLILLAAILLEWEIFDIVVVFWVENLVIGFYNIFKLALASGKPKDESEGDLPKIAMVPIFIIHFSLFCIGHGVFIMVLFSDLKPNLSGGILTLISPIFQVESVIYGMIAMLISHGISFKTNFLNKREYEHITPTKQMFSPYKRLALVHGFIIFSVWIIMSFGKDSILIMILFMLLKIAFDLRQHLIEHKKVEIDYLK